MQKGVDGGGQDRRSPGRDCRSHPKRAVRKPRRSGDGSAQSVLAGDHGRDHQAWERKEEYIEILERDKEQTLKTLWREEKLDELFFFGSETRQRVSSQRSRGYASAKRDRIAASREGYFMRLP